MNYNLLFKYVYWVLIVIVLYFIVKLLTALLELSDAYNKAVPVLNDLNKKTKQVKKTYNVIHNALTAFSNNLKSYLPLVTFFFLLNHYEKESEEPTTSKRFREGAIKATDTMLKSNITKRKSF